MSVTALVSLVLLVLLGLWLVGVYNNLVSLKHNVSKAWANIDVLLRQRHDELPKLVETCKQYMKHEAATLQSIIQARSDVAQARERQDMRGLGQAETGLRTGLGQLFALAEHYPELKANETFKFLQQRISGLESAIADRREFYNDSVNLNNVKIEQFPDVLIARFFNFKSAELLRFSDAEKADVNLQNLFS